MFSEVAPGYCSAFQDDYIVAEQDCQRILHPFICEKGLLIEQSCMSNVYKSNHRLENNSYIYFQSIVFLGLLDMKT